MSSSFPSSSLHSTPLAGPIGSSGGNMGGTGELPFYAAPTGSIGGPSAFGSSSAVGPLGSTFGDFAAASAAAAAAKPAGGAVDFDNEPPLLEELEIEPRKIWAKVVAVSFPTRTMTPEQEADTDLAGPFLLCLILGIISAMQGNFRFGYIFGHALLGASLVYLLINLLHAEGISFDRTASILGYCLLPLCTLASLDAIKLIYGAAGSLASAIMIGWCTFCATRYLERALQMREQRWLIAYPLVLLYACFALLTCL